MNFDEARCADRQVQQALPAAESWSPPEVLESQFLSNAALVAFGIKLQGPRHLNSL